MDSTSLDTEDRNLYVKLRKLKATISVWGKVIQPGVTREEIALRVMRRTSRDAKSLNECQELLRVSTFDAGYFANRTFEFYFIIGWAFKPLAVFDLSLKLHDTYGPWIYSLAQIAFNDFKAALDSEELTLTKYLTVVNYLTAMLCLKHCQRKSVVEGFPLTGWLAG